MSTFIPPTASNIAEWVRKAAGVVNRLQRAPFQTYATAPQNPNEGDGYYDLTTHMAYIWNGTAWQPLF